MSCQGCWWAVCSPFSLLSNDNETTSFPAEFLPAAGTVCGSHHGIVVFLRLGASNFFWCAMVKEGHCCLDLLCFFFFVIFVTDWDLPWVNHHHEVNPPFLEKIFCPTFFHPHHKQANLRLVKPWWNLGYQIDGSMASWDLANGGWLIDLHPEGAQKKAPSENSLDRCLPLKKVDKAQFVEKTHRKVWKEQKVLKKLKLHLFMRIFLFWFPYVEDYTTDRFRGLRIMPYWKIHSEFKPVTVGRVD